MAKYQDSVWRPTHTDEPIAANHLLRKRNKKTIKKEREKDGNGRDKSGRDYSSKRRGEEDEATKPLMIPVAPLSLSLSSPVDNVKKEMEHTGHF